MRIRLVPALAAASLGLVLAASTGCRTMTDAYGWAFLSGEMITYDQYQTIDPEASPKPTADDVINTLGKPMAIHDRNGARVRIDYHAYGLDDSLKRAEFHFDKNEKLVKKELW
ncbi:MAG: hypothetical protein K8T90_01995 [Planctomycetes bacterium]|nr:hypothetical protein [Planctomycetota bacterium]